MNGKPTQEMLDYARELYMVLGRRGKHKNSLQKIAEAIHEKFEILYTKQGISKWTKRPDDNGTTWESQYKSAIATGITTAKIEDGEKKGKIYDEVYQDAVVNAAEKEYKNITLVQQGTMLLLKGVVASLVGEYKKLLKQYDNKPQAIPIKTFKENFSDKEMSFVAEIEEAMAKRAKDMVESSALNDDKRVDVKISIVDGRIRKNDDEKPKLRDGEVS